MQVRGSTALLSGSKPGPTTPSRSPSGHLVCCSLTWYAATSHLSATRKSSGPRPSLLTGSLKSKTSCHSTHLRSCSPPDFRDSSAPPRSSVSPADAPRGSLCSSSAVLFLSFGHLYPTDPSLPSASSTSTTRRFGAKTGSEPTTELSREASGVSCAGSGVKVWSGRDRERSMAAGSRKTGEAPSQNEGKNSPCPH
ncbi:hypothetical protein XENOCAPTIV_012412 [Xenoophorus captivus]|uniref:Uncharacterized protein n=1 Tax=Xenoophorus captivus TaxID=1517983 RepID=A0ABV0QHX9_9TELE